MNNQPQARFCLPCDKKKNAFLFGFPTFLCKYSATQHALQSLYQIFSKNFQVSNKGIGPHSWATQRLLSINLRIGFFALLPPSIVKDLSHKPIFCYGVT